MELFLLKLFDCVMSTLKTIFLYKNKNIWSAICNSLATLVWLIAVQKVAQDSGLTSIITLTVATFLGSYFTPIIANKFEKDKVWVYHISSDTFQDGIEFADKIRELNIPICTDKRTGEELQKILYCQVFSKDKTTSEIIESLIPLKFKYHVVGTKTYD